MNRAIEIFEISIITVCTAIAALLIFANVVARYFLNSGITWALELTQYLIAWSVLVGAAHCLKKGLHLGIDILIEKLSDRAGYIIQLISYLCVLLFSAISLYYSVKYVLLIKKWGDLTMDMQIPQWIPYLALIVGLFLMTYHSIYECALAIKNKEIKKVDEVSKLKQTIE